MKIQATSFINNIGPSQINIGLQKPSFKSAPISDVFCKSKEKGTESYQNFLKDCQKAFPNKTVSEILSTVSEHDNFIGEGKESRVYKIEGLDDYVVKLSKNEYDYDPEWYMDPIRPCKDDFPEHNFGQPVATVGFSAKILKKVTGKENGVKSWFSKFEHSTPRTREDAEKILADVTKIASFPQESFNKLAQEIKYLTSKGIKIDSINPNNFLIDYDKKQISLVDIENKEHKNSKNTMYDLLVPLLDLVAFGEYKELFDEKEMTQFLNSGKIIYKKIAKTNLPNDLEYDKKFRMNSLISNKGIRELDSVVDLIKN